MRRLLRSRSIAFRLCFLSVLFGAVLALSCALTLYRQWEMQRERQIDSLKDLVQVVTTALDAERAAGAAAHLPDDEVRRRSIDLVAGLHFGNGNYFSLYETNGTVLYHPDRSIIGKDFTKAVDADGFHFAEAGIKGAVKDGAIIVDFRFHPVGVPDIVPKMALYALYRPYGWVISDGIFIQERAAEFWASARETVGVATGLLLVVIGVAVMIGRSVVRPLRHIKLAMGRIAENDFDITLPEASRGGEIGDMAKAVHAFRDAGLTRVRLEQETANERRQADEERKRNEQARLEAAQAQAFVVSAVATGLERLAAGDLTVRLEDRFAPEYERVRANFNEAMAQLLQAMSGIAANTAGIRSGTLEITHASDDLSRRTEQQAASLEQTASTLQQITATVAKTADSVAAARDVVAKVRGDAAQSGQVTQDAVSAMSEIEKSARQISQIIGVIDEIAFQTSLLALNAGVEAARAGDAGRGFAVVASEVRALAQRSAEAAKEIKALISTSTKQVDQGVVLVNGTGQSLTRIVSQIDNINVAIAEIADSAKTQATGLAEVSRAVTQMDQVTQQNAAKVEESTAAAHALKAETEELARLTERFELGDETDAVRPGGTRGNARAYA